MSTQSAPTTDGLPVLCPCGASPTRENLDLHNFLPRALPPLCASCEAKEEAKERKAKETLRKRREATERQSRLSVIPPEMQRTRTNHPGFNAGLWLRVEGWKPSEGKWLGLVGDPGKCKTRILSVLAERLILEGHRLAWTSAVEFQERIDDFRGESQERKLSVEYLKEVRSAAILVFDDFGKNTWTPTVERHLFSLIDHRKTHDLPVLWSANSSPRAIYQSGLLTKDRGGPILGRLVEASNIITV